MRTTVELNPDLLAEAMRLANARTKKEVIERSLTEFVQQRHIEALTAMAGTMDLDLDLAELDRLRAEK